MDNPENTSTSTNSRIERGVWSEAEHSRFLDALKLYPEGPWKAVADHVATRSSRQVQTHAQRYYEKVARRVRGLRKDRKNVIRSEHRLDDEMAGLCRDAEDDEQVGEEVHVTASRRQLSVIAMRRRGGTSSDVAGTQKGAAAAVGSELDEDEEMKSSSQRNSAGDSSDSLSSLDDDYLDFLLGILASREYTEEEK